MLVRQQRVNGLMFNVTAFRKGGSKKGKITNAVIYFIAVQDVSVIEKFRKYYAPNTISLVETMSQDK